MKYLSSLLFSLIITLNICGEGFVAGTLVKTPHGYKLIEEIGYDDLVVCHDFNGSFALRPVTDVIKKTSTTLIHITLENDEQIIADSNHKFYVSDKKSWVNASNLLPDDYLLSYKLGSIRVQNILLQDGEYSVYNLSVDDYHNYAVSQSDILVHNIVFTIPLFTWVIGEGVTFFGGATVASLSAACGVIISRCFLEKVGEELGATVDLNDPIDLSEINEIQNFLIQEADRSIEYFNSNNKKQDKNKDQKKSKNDKNDKDKANEKQGKAPGKPGEKDGYKPPKNWDGKKKKHEKSGQYGWLDKKGSIWIPSGEDGHGGPHWDVQHRDGSYTNVLPGGGIRGSK